MKERITGGAPSRPAPPVLGYLTHNIIHNPHPITSPKWWSLTTRSRVIQPTEPGIAAHRPVLGPPEPGIAAHRPVPSRTAFRRWTRAWSCGGANVVRFVLNCPFPFGYPCCRLGSRRLRSKHPFSFWVSLQPMRFELHWLRLVGTLFYLRKYVCRYVRTS